MLETSLRMVGVVSQIATLFSQTLTVASIVSIYALKALVTTSKR